MIASMNALPAPDSALSLGWLCLAVFALLGGVNQILRITDRFRANPPLHLQYSTKAEHQELQQSHRDLGAKVDSLAKSVDAAFRDSAQVASVSREKLYTQLRDGSLAIARLSAISENQTKQLKDQSERLTQLNARVDEVPGRVLQLIKASELLTK